MCGISGKISLNSQPIDYFDIKAINEKVSHRGPDDSGIYISPDGKVGLGNQRLAIIDLSIHGHQPMIYKNRLALVTNGEIYNFREKRKELRKLGYKFEGNSDTEVLLYLYDKYGTDCLKHLRGMFAFAIYDKKRDIVFLARDRVGKKPLKYYFKDGVFIFASELKAILTQKEVKREVDHSAILEYLTYGYTIPPHTGFTDIAKLEPGHYLVLDIKNKTLTKKCYWQPDYSKKLDLPEQDWCKAILHRARESVKLRMVSDVPVGAFLSGGIDSSTVVALMAQNSNKPVKTFTIGFNDKDLDESKYAQNIADLYKTDHYVLTAEPENVENLPELARIYEEPFADASSVVTQMVCKMAKKHVTVVLNGDGGDENFVGYERYARVLRDYLFDRYGEFAKPFLSQSSAILNSVIKNEKFNRINKFLQKSLLPLSERYGSYVRYFGNEEYRNIGNRDESRLQSQFSEIEKGFSELGEIDPRDKALYWDMTRYLPNDLLAKVDIASMSVGLEARSPLLDQELIKFACQIPFDLKYKNGIYKYILKKAIKDLVPEENIYRRKVGFNIPLDRWFEGSLNAYAKSVLLAKNAFVSEYFDNKYIKAMLSEHSVSNDFGPRLWSLLSLELWHQAYF